MWPLPYLNSLAVCAVGATQAAGGIHWFLVPNLWDPYRDTWDLTEANVSNTTTPGYLRPPVRIRVVGSVGFGSVPAGASVKSGSVASGVTLTTFLGSLTGIDLNLSLVSGATLNNWHGRDGFLEAFRLRTNDINGSVTSFTPTNSPTTPLFRLEFSYDHQYAAKRARWQSAVDPVSLITRWKQYSGRCIHL